MICFYNAYANVVLAHVVTKIHFVARALVDSREWWYCIRLHVTASNWEANTKCVRGENWARSSNRIIKKKRKKKKREKLVGNIYRTSADYLKEHTAQHFAYIKPIEMFNANTKPLLIPPIQQKQANNPSGRTSRWNRATGTSSRKNKTLTQYIKCCIRWSK